MSYKNVLVGIDGSRPSKEAFYKAARIAKRDNASLHMLSVINGQRFPENTPKGYGFADNSIYQPAVDEMKRQLAEFEKVAKDQGISDVKTTVMIGSPKAELATKYPEEHDIDMLVLGGQGLNSVSKHVLGSTATYCVRVAKCDLTIVKTDNGNKLMEIKY